MTFDTQIQTDFQTALAEIRDKIGGMASWSIELDNWQSNGYFVLLNPRNERIVIGSNQVEGGSDITGSNVRVMQGHPGQQWDENNHRFASIEGAQAGDDAENVEGDLGIGYGNYSNANDPVEYWLQYTDGKGFVGAIRRTAGDGENGFCWFGHAAISKYWDAHTMATLTRPLPESMLGGSFSRGTESQTLAGAWGINSGNHNTQSWGGSNPGTNTLLGHGVLNPDDNRSNYIWQEHVAIVDRRKNTQTGLNPVYGEFDLWIDDGSGDDLSTGDVIQDTNGNDVFMLLNYHGERIAVSME